MIVLCFPWEQCVVGVKSVCLRKGKKKNGGRGGVVAKLADIILMSLAFDVTFFMCYIPTKRKTAWGDAGHTTLLDKTAISLKGQTLRNQVTNEANEVNREKEREWGTNLEAYRIGRKINKQSWRKITFPETWQILKKRKNP